MTANRKDYEINVTLQHRTEPGISCRVEWIEDVEGLDQVYRMEPVCEQVYMKWKGIKLWMEKEDVIRLHGELGKMWVQSHEKGRTKRDAQHKRGHAKEQDHIMIE